MQFAFNIGVTNIQALSLKVERGPSHKSKVKEYKFLTKVDEILESLNERLFLSYGAQTFNIDGIENYCLLQSK